MQSLQSSQYLKNFVLGLVIIILMGVAGFFWYQNNEKANELSMLQVAKTQLELESEAYLQEANNNITQLSEKLSQTEKILEELADDYRDEKNKNDQFEDQIARITGTINDLDKLSKTDEELLQKYSKVYFLNENYIPSNIKQIDYKYVQSEKRDQFFHGDAMKFLENLLDRAKRDGHDIKIVSAYRSFDEQIDVKGQHTHIYGSGANAFSADQGYSEHQLGTTVDFTVEGINGANASFAQTESYKWLLDNAHRYGFTLSYPENNSFYDFEPWHWRFVGTELARDLNRSGDNFYDLDQRKIDEYLLNIFD
jgi:LAS superfamily LD-carboxypeptidase LdcB